MAWRKRVTLGISFREDESDQVKRVFDMSDSANEIAFGQRRNAGFRNFVVFNGREVADLHAKIVVNQTDAFVRGVDRKVILNGEDVADSILCVGDTLTIGSARIVFLSLQTENPLHEESSPKAAASFRAFSPGTALVVATVAKAAEHVSHKARHIIANLVRKMRHIEQEDRRGYRG